ncbi:MAG TPA: hypothetical protein VGG49_13250 [Steroidobacteraceae bacterium]|jgi:hypothetical protein
MNRQPQQPVLEIGSHVHYSGDQCNQPGFFRIISTVKGVHILQEIQGGSGRQMTGVHDHTIGREYFGHCNPRLVTQESYDRFRADRLAQMQEVLIRKLSTDVIELVANARAAGVTIDRGNVVDLIADQRPHLSLMLIREAVSVAGVV